MVCLPMWKDFTYKQRRKNKGQSKRLLLTTQLGLWPSKKVTRRRERVDEVQIRLSRNFVWLDSIQSEFRVVKCNDAQGKTAGTFEVDEGGATA